MASGFRSIALLGLGVASLGIHASVQVVQGPDTLAAAAVIPENAAAALGDRADQLGFSTGSLSAVAVALADGPDQVAIGAGASILNATVAVFNGADGVSSDGTINHVGFGGLAAMPLRIGRLAIAGIGASAALADSVDSASSSAGNGVLLTSINLISQYRVTATPDLIVGDRIEVLSAIGGPFTDITINPDATFTMALASSVTSFVVRIWSITDQDWGGPATQFIDSFIASALTELPDQVLGTGGPVIGAAGTLTDLRDSAAGAVIVPIGFTAALLDTRDTLSAAIAGVIVASTGVAEQNDNLASTAVLALSITAAPVELPDLLSSITGASQAVLVSVLQELNDSMAGDAVTPVSGLSSIQDLADRLAAAAVLPSSITSAVFEDADGVVSVIAVARSASAALLDANLELLANSAVAMVANFTGLERADILRAGASLILSETAGGFVAELIIPARIFTLSLPARSFTLSPDHGKNS